MKWYEYETPNGKKRTYVRDGWCQFHTMCAQTRFFTMDSNTTQRFCIWDFVSYETPICRVWHDTTYDVWYVTVNEKFDCSRSTAHQFSRWLSEQPICHINYHDIKRLDKLEKSGTPDISTVSFTRDIHVSFCSDSHMRKVVEW